MTKPRTRALFWDIDGTLLVTGRAGMIAWERAFADMAAGRPFPAVRPDGLTDHQIAAWLLDRPPFDEVMADDAQQAIAELVAAYEAHLPGALPLRQGRVLDNVRPVLEWLAGGSAQTLSWLVTGNTRGGGTAKLRYYGLSRFFIEPGSTGEATPLAGAFSRRVEPRANIVRRALEMAQARVPGLTPAEVLVVGDTPHDIEGAHAIGVPVLAVASNTHTLEELCAHHPWRALPALPAADLFSALLEAS